MASSYTRRIRARRAGAALLEAVVALAVLGGVAGSSIWLASDALHGFRRVTEEETQLRAAQRLLTAVSLWPSSDLDLRLGERPQGPWLLYIQRKPGGLYEIEVADAQSRRPLLRTAVFRQVNIGPADAEHTDPDSDS